MPAVLPQSVLFPVGYTLSTGASRIGLEYLVSEVVPLAGRFIAEGETAALRRLLEGDHDRAFRIPLRLHEEAIWQIAVAHSFTAALDPERVRQTLEGYPSLTAVLRTVNRLYEESGEEEVLKYLQSLDRSLFWAFYALIYDDLQCQLSFCKELLEAHRDYAKGPDVLDIGAGTGLNTVQFAELGYRGVVIEPNPDMALQLREKLAAYDSFEIVASTFENAQLPGRDFDTVTLRNMLYLVADPPNFLRKAFEHTRRGGRILVSNLLPGALNTYPQLIQAAEAELQQKGLAHLVAINRLMGPISRLLLGPASGSHFFSKPELIALLAQAGFSRVIHASDTYFQGRAVFVAAERPT